MSAFLPSPFLSCRPLSHSPFPSNRNTRPNRRRPLRYIVSQQSIHDNDSLDDFVSDTTHVVLDASDIPAILDRLKGAEDNQDSFFDEFLQQAEHHVDGTPSPPSPPSSGAEAQTQAADYFHPEFLPYLPRWARDAFHADDTISLSSTQPISRRQRLHDIAEHPAGIIDCLLSDVAEDYSVPIEFVLDAVLTLGVEPPIAVGDSVKDTLNDTQIGQLLRVLSTFDAVDLADRYSDRSVKEMADDYDLHLDHVIQTCEQEGFHMCSGSGTRLSLVQEDRILDILLKDAPMGTAYPSPLEGLV